MKKKNLIKYIYKISILISICGFLCFDLSFAEESTNLRPTNNLLSPKVTINSQHLIRVISTICINNSTFIDDIWGDPWLRYKTPIFGSTETDGSYPALDQDTLGCATLIFGSRGPNLSAMSDSDMYDLVEYEKTSIFNKSIIINQSI